MTVCVSVIFKIILNFLAAKEHFDKIFGVYRVECVIYLLLGCTMHNQIIVTKIY